MLQLHNLWHTAHIISSPNLSNKIHIKRSIKYLPQSIVWISTKGMPSWGKLSWAADRAAHLWFTFCGVPFGKTVQLLAGGNLTELIISHPHTKMISSVISSGFTLGSLGNVLSILRLRSTRSHPVPEHGHPQGTNRMLFFLKQSSWDQLLGHCMPAVFSLGYSPRRLPSSKI